MSDAYGHEKSRDFLHFPLVLISATGMAFLLHMELRRINRGWLFGARPVLAVRVQTVVSAGQSSP